MATYAPYIYHNKPKADGTCRVYIRLTHNRQSVYLPTHYYVSAKARKGKVITDRLLLSEIDVLINAYTRKMILSTESIDDLSVKELAELLQKTQKREKKEKAPERISYSGFCREFGQSLENENRVRTGKNYMAALKRLEGHFGGVVYADQLTTNALEGFEAYLKSEGVGSRGINLYMTCLKRMFKDMCKRYNDYDTGEVKIKNDPWVRYEIPPAMCKKSPVLTAEQIRKLAALELTKRPMFGRDMWMLSFCLAGMNTIDMYFGKAPEGDRLEYNRRKTKGARRDDAFFSMLIQPEARILLEKYKHPEKLIGWKFASDDCFNTAVNKGLKVAGKMIGVPDLDFYMARHSFATIARNKCGVSKDDIGMALNHVDEEHKTTDIYLEKDWSIVDRVVRKVLDYVFGDSSSETVLQAETLFI